MAVCVGCGLTVVGNKLTTLLRPGGGLSCQEAGLPDDGLFITPGTVAPSSNTWDHATGSVKISTDPYNGIDATGTGIYARCPTSIAASQNMGYFGGTFPIGLTVGGTYNLVNFGGSVSIANPTPWTMDGFLDWQAYGGVVRANAGFDGYAYLSVNSRLSPAAGGFGVSIPNTNFRMDDRGLTARSYEPSNMLERNRVIIPSGATLLSDVRLTIQVDAGIAGVNAAGTWYDVAPPGDAHGGPPFFEFHAHLTQTDSC